MEKKNCQWKNNHTCHFATEEQRTVSVCILCQLIRIGDSLRAMQTRLEQVLLENAYPKLRAR